jgi:hypothetical protein
MTNRIGPATLAVVLLGMCGSSNAMADVSVCGTPDSGLIQRTPVGDAISPMIYNGSFDVDVIGIGTTQYVTANGALYSYAFGSTSGTNVLAAGDWLGWRDGGIAAVSGNNGHISLSFDRGPGINYYACDNGCAHPNAMTLGDQGFFSFAGGRTYSVNFTAASAPEPAFSGCMSPGLAAMFAAISRRRKTHIE